MCMVKTKALIAVLGLFSLTLAGCLPTDSPPVERPKGLKTLRAEDVPREQQERTGDLSPNKLGLAAYGMLAAASAKLLDSGFSNVGYDLPEEDDEVPTIVLTLGGNTRGELNLCDCADERRGGLARRATILRGFTANSIHIDTGDSLSEVVAALSNPAEMDAPTRRAEVILEAFGAMGLDLMLVNLRDLRVPPDRLTAFAQRAGVQLVSSNLLLDVGGSAFKTGIIYEREGHKLGFIGLTAHHRTNPRFLDHTGLTLQRSEEAVATERAQLEAAGADAVILLSGLGVSETEALLEALDESDLPDMVLVSGTSRLTKAPSWVRGVPLLEPGDRGRQLLIVTLYERDGTLNFKRPETKNQTSLGELIKATRRAGLQGRAYLSAGKGQKRAAAQRREKELMSLVNEIHTLSEQVLIAPLEPKAQAGFDVEWLDLEEEVLPSPDVQKLVDRVEPELP